MHLLSYLAKRALIAVLFVLTVSAAAFVLLRLAPGDATAELVDAGPGRAAAIAETRARLGLDRSAGAMFVDWASGVVRFDLGQSSSHNRPVRELVAESARHTAVLATVALILATVIGLPIGVLTGARPRSAIAIVVAPISIALVSCPPIVAALGLLFLAVQTRWISIAPGQLLIPSLALALPLAAALERLQSQATSDAMRSPDVVATAARGVPPARLIWVHAARRSIAPVLGIYGTVIATLFSGSLAVEAVTSWPGLGRLLRDAIVSRDLFLAAGCALVGAVMVAAGNLAADACRAVVDPRRA